MTEIADIPKPRAQPGAGLDCEGLTMFAPSNHRPLAVHIWNKEPDGFYVEPFWVSERLFEVEKFDGTIWDPACGTTS